VPYTTPTQEGRIKLVERRNTWAEKEVSVESSNYKWEKGAQRKTDTGEK